MKETKTNTNPALASILVKAAEERAAHKLAMETKHGLVGHPKADELYRLAWDMDHSGGYSEVEIYYTDMAGLLMDHQKPNPVHDWQDVALYTWGLKESIPTSFMLTTGCLQITVTCGRFAFKEGWVMHCYEMGIDPMMLEAKTKAEAQVEAIAIVKNKAQRIIDSL